MNLKQKLGAAASGLGLALLAAVAIPDKPAIVGGKDAATARPTLSFNHVACTILVNDKPIPPDVIIPYPSGSPVRSFNAATEDGATRHYSVGFDLDPRTFSVSIFDNDESVPDPSGSFNVHPTLAHDSVPAQLPVINFQLRTPKKGTDPVIGVNCLSH